MYTFYTAKIEWTDEYGNMERGGAKVWAKSGREALSLISAKARSAQKHVTRKLGKGKWSPYIGGIAKSSEYPGNQSESQVEAHSIEGNGYGVGDVQLTFDSSEDD